IIALAGILHLIESILIIINGWNEAVPVVLEGEQGNPVGAFVTEKTWPIPLILLVVPFIDQQTSSGGISMPQWWPIFESTLGIETLALLPLAFIINYKDITTGLAPKRRSVKAGFTLLACSLIVIILALISKVFYPMKYAVIALVPLIYLIVGRIDLKRRKNEKAIYDAPWRGLRILGVYPDMPAFKMGARPGDILLNINGRAINSIKMLNEALSEKPSYIWLDISRGGHPVSLEHRDFQNNIEDLGLMFVPRRTGRYYKNEMTQDRQFNLKKDV
ncbi:MAG TPA: hypothetical protein VFD33_05570, partial [Bacillota bacterium]|nr:hypothetical protein [Bacillota bacterium]